MTAPATHELLREIFDAAVAAADPKLCVPQHMPEPPVGRTIVIGAGKASAAMARAFEDHWDGEVSGLVLTRYGHGVECEHIEIVEASHPVPDEAGQRAAARIGSLVDDLTEDDLVVCLISGGGSALLSAPASGLTLDDKQIVNRELLACGAPITEMNCVRKHLSGLKGGRLAMRAAPARMWSLIISDVPGDDPSVVASGPTVPDPSTREDAMAIIRKYHLDVPVAVTDFLMTDDAETPKPGDARFDTVTTRMIATPAQSLAAAISTAEAAGYDVISLGDQVEGEAREVAREHASQALALAANGQGGDRPLAILSGGETTVTVKGNGRGGRNAEYALGLAIALDGHPAISAIAGDTDGIDGSEDNAGAIVLPDTLTRSLDVGLDAAARLENNDGYGFFEGIGDLVMTGPTLTNVNDLRAILIDKDV